MTLSSSSSVTAAAASTPTNITNNNAILADGASQLYVKTPLMKSIPLSNLVGRDVYLKLDVLQASGSFKDRGMAHFCATLVKENVTELISSSGGNAGLAVATVGRQLNMSVQVIVPTTTKPLVIAKLQSLGAHVTVHGRNWNEADTLARQRVQEVVQDDETGQQQQQHHHHHQRRYVSPYDHPLLWTGHSTIVDEILQHLSTTSSSTSTSSSTTFDPKISAMVVSVGGGGLLCGVLEGCARHSSLMDTTKIIACETQGASSFGQAWEKGHVVTLPGIDSIATSLGATSVTPVVLERAKAHPGGVLSAICTDAEAIDACVQFAQDHRLLVEPACGAALAVLYSDRLRHLYFNNNKKEENNGIMGDGPIVVEVCGGSGVNVDLLHQWKEEYCKSDE